MFLKDDKVILTKYTSVKVPKNLANKIVTVLEENGYRSVSEFVLDSSRRRLEQLEK